MICDWWANQVTENKFMILAQIQFKQHHFVKETNFRPFDEINVYKFYAMYGVTNWGTYNSIMSF